MLLKWKSIIANWIDCYFNEGDKKENNVTLDSLVNIIQYLRENLNLDESKSSILEAHTADEFVLEKFPGFKLENGTLEAVTEDDVYIVASLLLFFVCVNSKDVDIKSAMCNKLSAYDQETILKFSKCLMDCSSIMYTDVLSAITEACGQDIAGAEPMKVPETPPTVRSLHSEVRHLMAALDAERFDKNYLQDELTRTNLKMERYIKEREQYKLDILNLKTKISLCCDQETENKDLDNGKETVKKLTKRLQEIEESLGQQLFEAQTARDIYKSKVDELKQERDKWLTLNQQERSQVERLTQELENERRTVQSLSGLVQELRQHNQLNGLDTSLVECDNPDVSLHSLHNTSVCSEVCVNVVEVQLGEERAKTALLNQQIQALQDDLKEAARKLENEKKSYEAIIADMDTNIYNLKHRINEEIQDKNAIKKSCNEEVTKLNNDINELEQNLKEIFESSRRSNEKKIQEMQMLQEENLALLQNFTEETTKLEGVIKSLNVELDNEKTSKTKLREEYENQIMRFNEKILNRNNELVELQNNIFDKSEKIEELHAELRKEKELREELSLNITRLSEEKAKLENNVQEKTVIIETTKEEFNNLKKVASELTESNKHIKENLFSEIQVRDATIQEYEKQIDNIQNMYHEGLQNLQCVLDEKAAEINTLQMRFQDEIKFKVDLQKELEHTQKSKTDLADKVLKLNSEISNLKLELKDKDSTIEGLNLNLKEGREEHTKLQCKEKEVREELSMNISRLSEENANLEQCIQEKTAIVESMAEEINNHKKVILELTEINKQTKKNLESEIQSLDVKIQEYEKMQRKEKGLREDLSLNVTRLNAEKTDLEKSVQEKSLMVEAMIEEINNHKKSIFELTETNKQCKENLDSQIQTRDVKIQEYEESQLKEKELKEELSLNVIRLNAEKSVLEKCAQEKTAIIEVMTEEIRNNKKAILELTETYEQCKEILSSKIHIRDAKIQEYEKMQREEEGVKDQLSLEVSRLSEEKGNLEKSVQDKMAIIEAITEQINNHKKVISELTESNKKSKESLNNEIQIRDFKIQEYEKSHLKEKELKDELSLNVIQLNAEKANLEQSFQDKSAIMKALTEEINNYKKAILELTESNKQSKESLSSEIQIREVKIQEYERSLLKEKELIDKFSLNIRQLTTEKAELEKCVQEKTTVVEAMTKEIDNYKKAILELTESNKRLKESLNSEIQIRDVQIQEYEKSLLKEKELRDELSLNITQLSTEKVELEKFVEEKTTIVETMTKEINNFREVISGLQETNKQSKESLFSDIQIRDVKIQEYEKQVNNIKNKLDEQSQRLQALFDEKQSEVNMLQTQIQDEIKCKVKLQDDLDYTQKSKQELADELQKLKMQIEDELKYKAELQRELEYTLKNKKELADELLKLHSEISNLKLASQDKDRTIEGLDLYLKEERETQAKLQSECDSLNDKLSVLASELTMKDNEYKIVCDMFETEKEDLKNEIKSWEKKYNDLDQEIKEKNNDMSQIQEECTRLSELIKESQKRLIQLEIDLENETAKYVKMERDNEIKINELITKYASDLNSRDDELKKMTNELQKFNEEMKNLHESIEIKNREIQQEIAEKHNFELQFATLTNEYSELAKNMKDRTNQLTVFQTKCDELTTIIKNNNTLLKTMEQKLEEERKERDLIKQIYSNKIDELVKKNNSDMEKIVEDLNKLNNEIKERDEIIKAKINEIEEQKAVITNLTTSQEINKKELDVKSKELEHLQTKCEHIALVNKENFASTEQELKDKTAKCATLESRLIEVEEANKKYVSDIERITSEIEQLKTIVGIEEKTGREKYQKELECQVSLFYELRQKLHSLKNNEDLLNVLKKENDAMIKAVGQRETFAATSQDRASCNNNPGQVERDLRDLHQQVDHSSSSEHTHSSVESLKTISDLEKILIDKNRTITTLQSDITYMKTLMAESENKLMDVTKELENCRENCQQLSSQLKKLALQKNDEISEMKKQVSKMSVAETRATQIIKLSARYQAMIIKRVNEIKSNTVLKELTNFGNTTNCDSDLRRTLNAGTITMDDLENFLETTDRHLKRCNEKQLTLQKERDRLIEVNRINESEIVNLKKFLTELSVSFKTFSSVKEIYSQKLSRVVSIQRTVRREILNLDGRATDATMCKLERGYAAVMQDLTECAMNMERWVERCISRTISAEKIKQAFTSELDRNSIGTTSFQNASLEVHLGELENSFSKLLEEVVRAQKGEGARDAQAVTVMEVRAEYEDKLNRMKAKMKELYQEQIALFKERHKQELRGLESELQRAQDKLVESSKAYEDHIRGLSTELWSVGEKLIMKNDEAEWWRKQRSGSLMSLQHVHSSGLVSNSEEAGRPSDTHSLRSLQIDNGGNKRDRRGLHMSDEEGEVFDNRCLREIAATPKSRPRAGGQRLSELQWRNSLCPPHLKSSYPAETQFAQALREDDIKQSGALSLGGKARKEVGITAYKKPGPPTPSKQAGRLSATDSELRESLRVEAEPAPRKLPPTPSRLSRIFRSSKQDSVDGTPRTRRLSLFRKK